jgi:FkbM family methyltransferase
MRWLKALAYYGYSLVAMLIWFKNWPSLIPLFLRRSHTGTRKLKLRRPNLEILVRSAMDVWSVKETFVDQFYTRYGVPVQDGWTVVDIGAGIGDYCLYAAERTPAVTVFAFEPYKESYALLTRNLALNGFENVHAFQKAIWSKTGELALDLSTGEPLQISSQEPADESRGIEATVVDALTLQDLFLAEKIEKVDLLKMDCEGAEYEILLTAPDEVLQKVERIIMEYHDVDDTRSHPALVRFLKSRGYNVKRHPNYVHKAIGYLFAARF